MIENKRLIAEVKKMRALWDPTSVHYKNVGKKQQLWEEICRTLLPDFDELNLCEKDVVINELRTKWRNLRDCYIRYLRLKATSKRSVKEYVYASRLKFLNEVPGNRPSGTENDGDQLNEDGKDGNNGEDGKDDGKDDSGNDDDGGGGSNDDIDNDDCGDRVSPVEIKDESDAADQNSNHTACISIKRERKCQNTEPEQSSDYTERKHEQVEVKQSPKLPVSTLQRKKDNKSRGEIPQPRTGKRKMELMNFGDSYHLDNSDDMDFFRSLLPLITSLPLQQKIRFRMDVMRTALQYHENTLPPTIQPSCYFPASISSINPNFHPFSPVQNFPNMSYNAYQPYFQNNQPNTGPIQPPVSYLNAHQSSKKRASDVNQSKPRSSVRKPSGISRSPIKKSFQVNSSKGEGLNPVRTSVYSESDSSSTSIFSDSNSNTEKKFE